MSVKKVSPDPLAAFMALSGAAKECEMSDYKIEKGVPIPDGGRGRPTKYPLDKMDIGDSFVAIAPRHIFSIISFYGRHHGKKFTARKLNDREYRIWRIA